MESHLGLRAFYLDGAEACDLVARAWRAVAAIVTRRQLPLFG